MTPTFSLGVEEEYLIVDGVTGELRPRAERVLEAIGGPLEKRVQTELNLSQVEVETAVCTTLDEIRAELVRLRRQVMSAAEDVESRVVAMGTHPFTPWLGQHITPKERYLQMEDQYQLAAWQQLICGCHVHVGLEDPEAMIRVLDRCRPWLPAFLALSANSPFWEGIDTGYRSYRTQLWEHWPMTGTPGVLGSRAAYDALVRELTETGSILDATRLYWDVRPSARYPTLEFRIADVCLTVDEAVMQAGLTRSLVRTCHRQALEETPSIEPRTEVMRGARWRAARYGLDGDLIDLAACTSRPAAVVIGALLDLLRPDLEEHGEWECIAGEVARTLARGNGARRQREIFRQTSSLRTVVEWVVEQTRSE